MPETKRYCRAESGGDIGRRNFLLAVAAAATAGCARLGRPGDETTPPLAKPNVVLILMDDLGYADLACQGATDIQTPSIDSLAREGARFTNGYVTAPLCSPSRAGLMTGRYQQRFGHEFNTGGIQRQLKEDIGLPTSETFLAKALKAAGYATGAVGKWHLGAHEKYHPLNRGFDEFFGFIDAAHPYLTWEEGARAGGPIYRNFEVAQGDEYLTDAFSREAVSFIQRHQSEPFFLYLAYNAIHTPMQVTQNYLDRFPDISDGNRKVMAAMLSAADDGIGQVLETLRKAGLEENTLVFFLSDNGGPTPANASRNYPLRGLKATTYEGGIRVPFLLKWPRRVSAALVYDQPVSSLDVFPTALAAAGGKLPEGRQIDGKDILPYLSGERKGPPHDILFWRMGARTAVRRGPWKLVRSGTASPELYDLSKDIGEAQNLSQTRPEVLKDLVDAYARWESEMAEPLWLQGPAAQARTPREPAAAPPEPPST